MEQNIQTIKTWLGSGSLNIFGRPFAGKDTQGRLLADYFGGVMLSGGDILRHSMDNPRVQEIMASGAIIPSDLFEEIVVPFFSHQDLVGKPLILSEVGRVTGEDDVIMKVAEQTAHPEKAVIYLDLAEDDVWQRFEQSQASHDRGDRADDNKAVLQNRLNQYRDKVLPVIDFYRQKGLLIEVSGTLAREEVTAAIIEALAGRANT
jgi:adenylate kinase